jgi:hypothetical protein
LAPFWEHFGSKNNPKKATQNTKKEAKREETEENISKSSQAGPKGRALEGDEGQRLAARRNALASWA